MLVVDDWAMFGNVPHHQDTPESLWQILKQTHPSLPELEYVPLRGDRLQAGLLPLRKFEIFQEIAQRPDVDKVCWLVGPPDIDLEISVEVLRRELLFLIRASRDLGKQPVLATVPVGKGRTQDALREYALMTRELSAAEGVDVVDLYSSALRIRGMDLFYQMEVPDQEPSSILQKVELESYNTTGRRWILDRLSRLLLSN